VAQLSPHFSDSEFACKGVLPPPGVVVKLKKLCKVLEQLRILAGPLKITSGWRSPEHNASLKGSSKTSHHLTGEACDIQSDTLSPGQLAAMVLAIRANSTEMQGLVGEVLVEGMHLHLSIRLPFELMRDDRYA